MNVALLEKLKQNILEHPEGLDMAWNHCCVKHRLAVLTGTDYIGRYDATELLKLTDEQSRGLFRMGHVPEWPNGLEDRFNNATPGTKEYAEIVASYIDYLLPTASIPLMPAETKQEELVLCH